MVVVTQPRLAKKKPGPAGRSWVDDPEVGLMLRVQNDDAAAFAELVTRYGTQIFGRFYRRLGDRQEAEDLTQEVFLRLYRHRKRYRPQAKFATWLFHIAQNLLRNALRSRLRRPCQRLESVVCTLGEDAIMERLFYRKGEAPSRSLERAELAEVVRAAVSGLANRQRTAMELHQFHEWTYSEVAAEMKMTAKAAKSLLYRARNQLRNSLHSFVEAGR
jgi:RNA polymerase sigma-70 factor (ECF subfamily)